MARRTYLLGGTPHWLISTTTLFDDLVKSEVDKALQYLLDHEMISMEWDPDAEEMVFYMTDKQRAMPKPDDWDEKAP